MGGASRLDRCVPQVLHQLAHVLLEGAAFAFLLFEQFAQPFVRLIGDSKLLSQLALEHLRCVALPPVLDCEFGQLALGLLRPLAADRELLTEPMQLGLGVMSTAALALELGLGPRQRLRQRVDLGRQQRKFPGDVPVAQSGGVYDPTPRRCGAAARAAAPRSSG